MACSMVRLYPLQHFVQWHSMRYNPVGVIAIATAVISSSNKFFFLLALQPPLGFVFYSPLAGFRLLAYEVS